jgi:STE24 endopeptidase
MPNAQEPGQEAVSGTEQRAKAYQRIRNRLFFAGLLLQVAGLALVLGTGLTFFFKSWALAVHPHPWAVVFFYFLFFSLYFLILDFPLELYSGYFLERRYGLSTHSFRTWLADEVKKELLAFAFFALMIEILYGLIRRFPDTWWIFAWAAWLAVTLLLGKVGHLVILPLFYKCVRLPEGPVRAKIVALLEKERFPVQDVCTVNLSRSTRKANAAFCGFGATRRVLLADTLIENFTPEEIEAVVAHELGHCRRRHLAKGVLFGAVMSAVTFYAGFRFLAAWAAPMGFEAPGDIASFPLLGLVAWATGLFLMPAGNVFSRFQEREADDFAVRETGRRDALAAALRKLGILNLSDFEPHPLLEFLLYSHPSLAKRIRRVQSL